ncbi:D-aminoacyl-tRNA deacylase [Oscillospiraceae bacterium LTW-04]|nr:D-aminoacyl-tRNA deacylase [Oscillospiraceae bacterium MB24-C1]
MRAILQRVCRAEVSVDGKTVGETDGGYLILLGVKTGDTEEEARFLAKKTAELRVFTDSEGKMNLSLLDVGGSALVVSQFTLYADCKKGRRPAFVNAEKPPLSESLYLRYVDFLREAGVGRVETGAFGAHMLVSLENDGPVTILLDTEEIMPKH